MTVPHSIPKLFRNNSTLIFLAFATAYIVGGVYLALANYYSMNCFDHLFWALGIYLLVRILKGGAPRLWLLFGLVAGLGLENKYSMGFLGLGVIAGSALTPARRHFLDKWLWMGGALAALVFLPHVLWEVHNHLPPADKTDCVIGASNYGEAGAIDFFGKEYGLPNAISTHNNYWFWGPGEKPGKVLLVIGGAKKDYENLYEDVRQVATFNHPYAQESNVPIFLCRQAIHSLQEYWRQHHDFI